MKSTQNFFINGIVGTILLLIVSCDLQEENVNPSVNSEVGIHILLPSTQAHLTWAVADFAAQSTSIFLQYGTGITDEYESLTYYDYSPADFQTLWRQFYDGALIDLRKIIDASTEMEAFHYRGVARIQTAITLGYLVDFWGDVPYSEVFDKKMFPKPRYDRGVQIYQEIFSLLDAGIADLQGPSSTSPSNNDLFYPSINEAAWRATSAPKWIKAANSLKARFHIHLSKMDSQTSAQNALAAISAGGFQSNADNLSIVFGSSPDAAGPWNKFLMESNGRNKLVITQRFIDMLENRVASGINDPRLPYFVSPNMEGNYIGITYGDTSIPKTVSSIGPYVNSPVAPTFMMTYSELKFIEAEALIRLNRPEESAEAFNEAVAASLMRITGEKDADYIAAYGSETGTTMQADWWNTLFIEKHIDMYLQAESWSDLRRTKFAGAPATATGIPHLLPASGNRGNKQYPRRFLYPSSEWEGNADNIPFGASTHFARVFWDL